MTTRGALGIVLRWLEEADAAAFAADPWGLAQVPVEDPPAEEDFDPTDYGVTICLRDALDSNIPDR